MRFYDPEFGTVLIDGVDVKEYNIHELRKKMGLVMQEPTLFNYSVKENILYGNVTASNQEIQDAASIANAREFIESKTLEHRIVDEPTNLLENIKNPEFNMYMREKLGNEYDHHISTLEKLEKAAIEQGKFEQITDLIDDRSN